MTPEDTSLAGWLATGAERGWTPCYCAAVPWRWPGVRHVRTLRHMVGVTLHQMRRAKLGMMATGYDEWMLFGMWRGWV